VEGLKFRKNVHENTFYLTQVSGVASFVVMDVIKSRWCWRKDLAEFRGLTERERAGFLVMLEWIRIYENGA
jgi:hypothetical protein